MTVLDRTARVWLNGSMAQTVTYTAAVLDMEAAHNAGFIVVDENTVEVETPSGLEAVIEYDLAMYGIYEIDGVIAIEAP